MGGVSLWVNFATLPASKKSAMALSRRIQVVFIIIGLVIADIGGLVAQPGSTLLKWSREGNSYYEAKGGNIVQVQHTG